uniref:Uncharacterized protein n=1 Tax=Arundo donax TaxID=35708 RepID=A0A0A9GTF7_ARUDO
MLVMRSYSRCVASSAIYFALVGLGCCSCAVPSIYCTICRYYVVCTINLSSSGCAACALCSFWARFISDGSG